jgi:hypothetical protein
MGIDYSSIFLMTQVGGQMTSTAYGEKVSGFSAHAVEINDINNKIFFIQI